MVRDWCNLVCRHINGGRSTAFWAHFHHQTSSPSAPPLSPSSSLFISHYRSALCFAALPVHVCLSLNVGSWGTCFDSQWYKCWVNRAIWVRVRSCCSSMCVLRLHAFSFGRRERGRLWRVSALTQLICLLSLQMLLLLPLPLSPHGLVLFLCCLGSSSLSSSPSCLQLVSPIFHFHGRVCWLFETVAFFTIHTHFWYKLRHKMTWV